MAGSDLHGKLFDASSDGDDTLVRELLLAGTDPDIYKNRFGNTALLEAASNERDSTVSILLHQGADLNIQNNYGWSPLHCAAENGNNVVSTILIKAGANLNIQNQYGWTALHRAARRGNNEVTKTLIEAGADLNIQNKDGETALYRAAENGNNEVTTTLIEAGADLNIQNNNKETALHRAARRENNEVIKALIEAGADLNIHDKNGETALYRAAEIGNSKVATIFIEAGADLNIQDNNEETALHRAARKGNNQVTTTLIKAGADLNIQDKNGETALYRAAENKNNEVTTSLIKAGADLNIRNKNGETALYRAAEIGNTEVTSALIKARADINIQNNDGETPLERAASCGYLQIVSLLIDVRGKELKKVSLAIMMMNKDPDRISSVLDFLSKKLDVRRNVILKILGIEIFVGEEKTMFYLVRCKEFDGKSLLEFIDSQNVRLTRQREELIDLSVKIANRNYRDDTEKAMEEVINHFKFGLPCGVGLRDMITQIKERYPWSSSKKKNMIFLSLLTCLLGIGLHVFDLTSDIQFSLHMLKKFQNEKSNDEKYFNYTFKSIHPKCYDDMKYVFNEKYNRTADFDQLLSTMDSAFKEEFKRKSNNKEQFIVTAWISIWHCIQPFMVTAVAFITINYKSGVQCSLPDIPDVSDYLGDDSRVCRILDCLLCCIPFKVLWPLGYLGYRFFKGLAISLLLVPIPALTNLTSFYLDVRRHHARSKPDFRTRIVDVEIEIREHEALGKLFKKQKIQSYKKFFFIIT